MFNLDQDLDFIIEFNTQFPSLSSEVKNEKDGVVEIKIDGEVYFIDILSDDFTWRWTAPDTLSEGIHIVEISIIDIAGNRSSSRSGQIVIDTIPPEAPSLTEIYDDQGKVTGAFSAGESTDDTRPTLTGVAQAGTVVYLRDAAGNNLGSAVADSQTGVWEMEPEQDLPLGDNSLTLVAVEYFAKEYREGISTPPFIIYVSDKELPADTITIIDAYDDVGPISGDIGNGNQTDDTTPTLRGEVSYGSDVLIYYRQAGSSVWIGSAAAQVSGETWTWTPDNNFAFGQYEFQARIDNASSALFELNIYSDSADKKPTAPKIIDAWDDFGDADAINNNGFTDDRTPTLRGEGTPSSVTHIYVSGGGSGWKEIGSVMVGYDGKWEFTSPALPIEGIYQYQAIAKNSAGLSNWSAKFYLNLKSDLSKIIDFEDTFNLIPVNVISGRKYVIHNDVDMYVTNNYLFKTSAKMVTAHNENETLGSRSLELAYKSDVSFYAHDYPHFRQFSVEVFNPTNHVIGFHLNATGNVKSGGYKSFSRTDSFSLSPGQSRILTGDDLRLDSTHYIVKVNINADTNGAYTSYSSDKLIVDNFSYDYSPKLKYSSEQYVDDSIHSLTSVGEYITQSIIGKEAQIDTALFTGKDQTLDLIALNEKMKSIESFDLTGSGDNTLRIDLANILQNGDKNLFIIEDKSQILVKGDQGDVVELDSLLPDGVTEGEWQKLGDNVTIAGMQYEVFSHSGAEAELLVQQGVHTELI